MKTILSGVALLLLALPILAIENDDCAMANQLAALYQVRALMLKSDTTSYDVDKFIDAKIDALRVPLSGGGFRWVRWVRPSGNPPYDKHGHSVVAVQGSGSDHFEASADHGYSVRIVVPSKRSLFSGNNAVYAGTAHVSYTVNGRERTKDEPINEWMNPDTSRTVDLGVIADHVGVSVDASTAQKNAKQALIEIHVLKAVPEDDPGNPSYETILTLRHLRDATDSDAIDDEIAKLEPGSSLPIVGIVHGLRRAEELLHSKKQEDLDKGDRLLKETLRRLR
jgi:hypothetical protein